MPNWFIGTFSSREDDFLQFSGKVFVKSEDAMDACVQIEAKLKVLAAPCRLDKVERVESWRERGNLDALELVNAKD